MSYHVELEATLRDDEDSWRNAMGTYSVGTFAGGELGPMVAIYIGDKHIQLTKTQLKELRKVLKAASKGSLYGYPGAS